LSPSIWPDEGVTEPVVYQHWPALDHEALQRLFELAWGSGKPNYDCVLARSFTWVAAFAGSALVGFIYG